MRRFPAILLSICFLALGTGTLEYLHNLDHAREDARQDALAAVSGHPVEHHEHDDNNCEIHAQLHMAVFVTSWVPILVCLGLFVAFLTLLDTPLVSRLAPARIDCRGPPACLSSL